MGELCALRRTASHCNSVFEDIQNTREDYRFDTT